MAPIRPSQPKFPATRLPDSVAPSTLSILATHGGIRQCRTFSAAWPVQATDSSTALLTSGL